MLHRCRRALDSCSCHVYRTDGKKLTQNRHQTQELVKDSYHRVTNSARHVYRTATDETELVVLPLQRQPEDVRPTLGVSVLVHYRPTTNIVRITLLTEDEK